MERREAIQRALEMAKAGSGRGAIARATGLTEQDARGVITYLELTRELGTPSLVDASGKKPLKPVTEEEILDTRDFIEGSIDLVDDETEEPVTPKKKKDPKYSYAERARMAELHKDYDPSATAEDCKEDLQRLQQKYPFRTIFRNMYRAEGHYSETTWTQFFGNMQEFRAQAGLEPTRYHRAHEKAIAKHSSLDHYPVFYNNQIDNITWMYPRAQRKRVNTLAVISDNHDVQQDPFVWRVWCETLLNFQPDVVGMNGDQADCYEFNRYGIDPRQADVVAKLSKTRSLFQDVREICPNSEIIWNLGNHEWRIQKHMADATPYLRAVLADFMGLTWADIFGVRDLEININCKWDLKAYMKRDVQEQVANNYVVLWECFAMKHIIESNLSISGTSGHTHRPETRTYANLSRGRRTPLSWTVTGSGCRGDAEYAEGLDRTSQGFALFHIMPDTGIVVPENVIIQGDFAAVAGKYYYRQPDEY